MDFEKTQINHSIAWNQLALQFPSPHILQSWQWGEVKEQFGWKMFPLAWRDRNSGFSFAAMVLRRGLSLWRFRTPFHILYAPRGPLADWTSSDRYGDLLQALEMEAKKNSAISIKIDPALVLGTGFPGEADHVEELAGAEFQAQLKRRGWVYSSAQVQFRNTILIDLTSPEDEILARMKQKTRYNIRLSTRKGVTIRQGTAGDIDLLYQLYLETSLRDGFVIRSEHYYRTLWEKFIREGLAHVLIAEFEGLTLGGLILFTFGRDAWYFYGMSLPVHNEKMPNYLLQWEAMRLAKEIGCEVYDMWGAPETFDETDSMWGVYRFKSGFGGTLNRTLGAWDFAPRKGLYTVFQSILPAVLGVMRRRRISQEQQEAG